MIENFNQIRQLIRKIIKEEIGDTGNLGNSITILNDNNYKVVSLSDIDYVNIFNTFAISKYYDKLNEQSTYEIYDKKNKIYLFIDVISGLMIDQYGRIVNVKNKEILDLIYKICKFIGMSDSDISSTYNKSR